jgi:uncharacterized lipoprotein YmbA
MRLACSLFLLTMLAACSGSAVEPNYYLLRTDQAQQSRALAPDTNYALGNVVIAPYIDQQGLVLETSAGQMRAARSHLWAEPMFESIRAFLIVEISQERGRDIYPSRLNRDATNIDVRIDQLHGTHDGEARLVAYWWLHKNTVVQSSHQFAETLRLSEDGYAALADAERRLLSDLAHSIARSLPAPN